MPLIEQLQQVYQGTMYHLGGELGKNRLYLWNAPTFKAFIKVDLATGGIFTASKDMFFENEWIEDCWQANIPAGLQ